MHVIAAKSPPRSRPAAARNNRLASANDAAANSWQAEVSLTLTQCNEGARGERVHAAFTHWLMCSSQMKQRAEWYDTRLAVTHVFAANVYWCWWAHSTHAARHSYFDPLFFYFCPLFPVFCLLATSNQSSEMEAGPSGTRSSSLRSREEMNIIMCIRQPGGHLTSQVGPDFWRGGGYGRRNLI